MATKCDLVLVYQLSYNDRRFATCSVQEPVWDANDHKCFSPSRPGSGGVKPDAALQLTRDGDPKRVATAEGTTSDRDPSTHPLTVFSFASSLGVGWGGFVVLKMRQKETSKASTAAGALVQGHERRHRDLIGLPPWISHASVM